MTASAPQSQAILNAITVDVEDYYHVEAFAGNVARSDWDQYPSRVVQNTRKVLDLFARNTCVGTFFTLGWIAERFPSLLREIVSAGHEVACHSYAHQRVSTMTPEDFRADIRRAKAAIEDASGERCLGYRAPSFSIVKSSLWALDILAEEGFAYDSSIFPIRHDIYGFPDAPRHPHVRQLSNGRSIVEIPMSTFSIGGSNLPFSGGGYMRILPMTYIKWAARKIVKKEGVPVVVYFHPWEVDPNQPRINAPWKSRFRHYTGLTRMETRLASMLKAFRFGRMIDLVTQGVGDSRFVPQMQR